MSLLLLREFVFGRLMARWLVMTLSAFSAAILAGQESQPQAQTEDDVAFWKNELQPFLQKHCYDCHTGEGAEADIDFESYSSHEQLTSERPRWNQVRGMIEIGAMPPPDYEPLPNMEQREKIAQWIDRKVNTVDCELTHDPGRVTMRRLNNVEYDNSLRDLLGIDFSPSALIGFPSDGVGNGFDNQGDVLTLSPLQLEKYLQAAKLVASKIIVTDRESLREQNQDLPALYLGDKAGVKFLFADGEYEIKTRLKFEDDQEKGKIPVILQVDGQEVGRIEVSKASSTFRMAHAFTAGEHELSLHFADDPGAEEKEYDRRIETNYIGIEGPKYGDPALPLAHQRLFVAYPSKEKSVEQAALEIFQPLVRRALRRDPLPIEVQRIVNLVKLATDQGESFEESIGIGLQSVLVSPNFLFRVEGEDPSHPVAKAEASESLSDVALASRLSFFLWASCPDDKLLDLASQGKLSKPKQLARQTKRMLADPRSEALVTRFFGQYLGLGNLRAVDPDREQFPLWNDHLREAIRKETEMFCQELVSQDLSMKELLLGDFTYVNPRLAELYGIEFDGRSAEDMYYDGPGFKRRPSSSGRGRFSDRGLDRTGLYRDEDRWIRVATPANRKGVLTQSAVLTLTSNPTSTSPVKRGKWILENLLGDPPPPAPPNVPGLEVTKKEHGDLSLREQLELHRANPSCASCHRVMDPLGLGFENFDAIGRWRDKDGKHDIIASGELAGGRKFSGAIELVDLLKSSEKGIMRNFAEKLLTYALGRGLEPYDNCAVQEIVDSAQASDYRFSAFIEAIINSEPFSQRRVSIEAPPVVAGSPEPTE
jgi:mono/diheme cytochrome c family protein